MRLLFVFLAVGLMGATAAGALPLSNKEIALMLRSGFTSDDILAETTTRRVLEALDPATKKSLVDLGASSQLVAALESGKYLVSTAEADEAIQREREIAERRAAQIEQDRKLNTVLETQQAASHAKATLPKPGQTLLLDSLKDKLVRCHDGTIGQAGGADLEGKKLIALYYSAQWCAPCRKFTPELVEYYNRVASAHPEFEVIFVSADRSHYAWETYIQEARMPWLAIDYDQLADLAGVKQLGGGSIPSLLLIGSDSHVVASTYDGDRYLGPQNVLAALDRIFGQGGSAPVAQAH